MAKKLPTTIEQAMQQEQATIDKTIEWLNAAKANACNADAIDISLRQAAQSIIYKIYRLQIILSGKPNNTEIAQIVGVNEMSIREWRDGHQTITPVNLVKLHKALDKFKKRVSYG